MNEEPGELLRAADEAIASAVHYLSISRYAMKYGVCRHTVYKWLREDLLDSYRVGGKLVRIKDSPPRQCA